MRFIRHFNEIEAGDGELVGGKGLSLGLLTRAGLPVPPGFCLTSTAYTEAASTAERMELREAVRTELCDAYRGLGGTAVAVRSSATAEDGVVTSFAGQQETLLGIHGDAALLDAVQRCWESLHSDRSRAYRQRQEVAEHALAMAVVVQRLVDAEVSGVLFTRDPLDPQGERMLVEAAWGLGESVVSGRVTPDRYHLRRADGSLIDQHVSRKPIMQTRAGLVDVPAERQEQPCLTAEQLRVLAELGRRIEAFYGDARDVEWAWAEGQFWILQARPITTAGAFEREELRRQEIHTLRERAEPRGTVWAKYNLAEILPAPTPMTWAIVRHFMSGRGGYGLMLRALGFDPDPALDEEGFIDLICGRPYVNLSREPRLYFRDFPAGHSFAALKAHPEKAMYPQPLPDSQKVTARFLLRLPFIVWTMLRNHSRMKQQSSLYANYLRSEVYPRFAAAVAQERQVDLTQLAVPELLERLAQWRQRTLQDFACEALRPAAFAALAMANLEQALKRQLGPEQAAARVRSAMTGVHPDPEADLPAGLQALMRGQLDREEFLRRFGHRGPQEMELAMPRWAEVPDQLPRADSGPLPAEHAPPPAPAERWQALTHEWNLDPALARQLEPDFHQAQTYTALRETSKHYLMMGYALIRRLLMELDRRYDLRGGVFYLLPEELPQLVEKTDLAAVIRRRRQERRLALSLELPSVLFSDDLEAIGRPIPPAHGEELQGVPLSAGVAEGRAWVLEEPTTPRPDGEGYVLVCPSTDPAWVPLFVQAQALVMETGGVLSHGAIVAREFGLPAVAGIPNIQRRLQTGQRLRVDGNTGKVYALE